MGTEVYPINIWINEERYQKLQRTPVESMAQEVLAGLKVIRVPATAEQKDAILKKFPMAKCDTATTGTIELIPRAVKDRLFDLVVERRSLDVVGDFLNSLE
ncbi:MAG: hypothetical protein ACE5IA_08170 [Dehalococcoidia bacterium]